VITDILKEHADSTFKVKVSRIGNRNGYEVWVAISGQGEQKDFPKYPGMGEGNWRYVKASGSK
jgi:hypothetical protein